MADEDISFSNARLGLRPCIPLSKQPVKVGPKQTSDDYSLPRAGSLGYNEVPRPPFQLI